jgi:flavin-dependent dehydrogenase
MPHEIVVVGAGPAGAVAALCLARAGVKVRLIDRARFPRDKLCGDTINPGTLALLDRLGVAADVRQVSRPIIGMMVSGPGGAMVVADYPDGFAGRTLRRSVLDQLLLDAAVRAGADCDDGVDVTAPRVNEAGRVTGVFVHRADGRDSALPAGVVIAADGRRSRLASALGLARWSATRRWAFGVCMEGVTGVSARGEMHIRSGGYIGIAPLPGGIVNLCVVRDFTDRRPAEDISAAQTISRAVQADAMLAPRFADAVEVSEVSVLGPLGVDVGAAGAPGLLLAGDAAGFVDPMTGDGLRFAIRGGELAARAAIEELTSGSAAHGTLAATRRAEFTRKLRFNRAVRWLTGSSSGMHITELLARVWSGPFEPLVRVAGDCGLARRLASG